MTTKELHLKLKQAYAIDNLNIISLTLIDLYKNKQYTKLQKIAEIISGVISIEIQENGKGFSKFMMLYHPDRCSFHINEIDRLASEDNYNGLLSYSHILLLNWIDEIANSLDSYEDVDYAPVYEWDFNTSGFSVVDDSADSEKNEEPKTSLKECNFYEAVKMRVFESVEMEFPSYYLEDLDELELSGSGISDLEGAEFCKHVVNLDLSDNSISDLSPLFGLSLLEDLNLSDNQIEDIDILNNLTQLKTLNLANNHICDISPLFELGKLDYVDLTGNKIKAEQIDALIEFGVAVDF
ncbi:MAG: leucine-rich repeat domain-containing protein [Bacteroidetes bacterium]|nr:leucine-rich repeat domain-containing protein [Bacteroidota bacterium]